MSLSSLNGTGTCLSGVGEGGGEADGEGDRGGGKEPLDVGRAANCC